jgi:anaerobic selenocysteine-containing dehydrogenase
LKGRRWHDCQPGFEHAHYLDGFANPDGKFHFAPQWPKGALAAFGPEGVTPPRLPDHWGVIDRADREHPFRMVTAPSRNYLNSTFTETSTSKAREKRPSVLVHPEAAAPLEIAEGDRVRLGNRRGSLVLHAELFAGLQPGVVVVESVWPNGAFEEGVGINLLTGADPAGPIGGAAFHDTAVWLRPAN